MTDITKASLDETYALCVTTAASCQPARIESGTPVNFRVAVYPDGVERLQGAYMWSEGTCGGMVWRDVPRVQVDFTGNTAE